jgi:DNA-binding NarL/FixJ family response regulator
LFCASKRTPHVRLWEGSEIRILLADDSEAFRRAVKDLLNENSGEWVVCGEATNGEDAVREVAELLPDVILLDLSIPLLHGLRVAKILKRDYPALAVIVMSEQDISVLSRMADAAGTRYCISKARAELELIPMLLSLRRNSGEQPDLRSD